MCRKGSCIFLVVIAVAWMLSDDISVAEMPSALVLEKSGVTNPDVQPYTEISVGKTITLSPMARLTFQHYHTCHTVIVIGGAVRFEAKTYIIKGGNKEREKQTPCPKTVNLKDGGEAGGVFMRSMMSRNLLTLSPHPNFVLVGKRANEFASVRVSRGAQEVMKSPLDGRRFQWPAQAVSLSADTEYEVALIPADLESLPVIKKFRVKSAKSSQVSQALILIRVD